MGAPDEVTAGEVFTVWISLPESVEGYVAFFVFNAHPVGGVGESVRVDGFTESPLAFQYIPNEGLGEGDIVIIADLYIDAGGYCRTFRNVWDLPPAELTEE